MPTVNLVVRALRAVRLEELAGASHAAADAAAGMHLFDDFLPKIAVRQAVSLADSLQSESVTVTQGKAR